MAKKFVQAYRSLNPAYRMAVMLSVILLLIIGSVAVATAAGGISISGQTPANGAVVSAGKPDIAADIAVTEGTVSESDVKMLLDGNYILPKLVTNSTNGTSKISYTPADNLSNGSHSVSISVYDTAAGSSKTTDWTFTVDAAPQATGLTPGDRAVVNTAAPKISAYIKDTFDNLNVSSATLKIDGVNIPAAFTLKGHTYTDTCSGSSTYVIDSYKEGTLEYQAANLSDGEHIAELSIADIKGNVLSKQWTFKIASAPKFTGTTPAANSEGKAVSGISVKVTDDNSAINPASIVLKVNNNQVAHNFDAATGTVSYNNSFASGKYSVTVTAEDTNGNKGTATWSFTVDNDPPAVNVTGLNHADGNLRFTAALTDLVDITPGTILKLDGQPLQANIQYQGEYDYYGDYIISSKKRVDVSYQGVIADGVHTLTLTGSDILGNTGTKTWTLNVETKPVITQWKPTAFISDLKPVISAIVKDGNNAVDPADIKMTLDGQSVTPSYNPVTGNLTYTPDRDLTNEAYHTVNVSVYDKSGATGSISWKFYTNTFPDMADADGKNCSACHAYDPNANNPFESVHKNVWFGGTHSDNRCDACHNYITYPKWENMCSQCHADPYDNSFPYAPHGSSPGIKYRLDNYDPNTPFRVTENREMQDCIVCHQPGSPVLGWEGFLVKPTRKLNNHDIPELHKTAASSCSECHALSLTREHARPGRLDNNGQPINCNTCHQSADANVKNAITGKNKNCTACHSQADHESVHVSGLDAKCRTCHEAALSKDHTIRKDNNGNNFTCDTCHANTGKGVKRTIAANSLNCAGCHKQGHNITLADKVPADIPLYAGYQWTTPMEVTIFAGEPSTPAGYESGQVVMSSRKSDVTAGQVWSFYNEQLIANKWLLKSSAPAAGADAFAVEFEKDGRFVTIKCYKTELSNGTGAQTSGYRIEIWYR